MWRWWTGAPLQYHLHIITSLQQCMCTCTHLYMHTGGCWGSPAPSCVHGQVPVAKGLARGGMLSLWDLLTHHSWCEGDQWCCCINFTEEKLISPALLATSQGPFQTLIYLNPTPTTCDAPLALCHLNPQTLACRGSDEQGGLDQYTHLSDESVVYWSVYC